MANLFENSEQSTRVTEVRVPVLFPDGETHVGIAHISEKSNTQKVIVELELDNSYFAELLKSSLVAVQFAYIPGEPSA